VGQPAGGELLRGGPDVVGRTELDTQVVERRRPVRILEEHELERWVAQQEVGIAGSLLARTLSEHGRVALDGNAEVGDVERELQAAGGHRGLLHWSRRSADGRKEDEAPDRGTQVVPAAFGRCVPQAFASSIW